MMKIIVGLGNPGEKYLKSRHNVGFLVLEALKEFLISNYQFLNKSQLPNFKFQKKFNAEILDLKSYNLDLMLIKPQTFMNDSGIAVKKIIQYNHLTMQPFNNLYIIHDDLDIVLGEYKIQFGKGPKQHNGILSIEQHLKTKDFWRVRIGINNRVKPACGSGCSTRLIQSCFTPDPSAGKDFVLANFSKEERQIINEVINKVIIDLENALSQP